MKKSLIAALLLGATVLPALQGCFPIVAAGVTTGVMATFDRRSVGTQTEDESIEWKASARVGEKLGNKIHVNFTSYNRKVLVTGEALTEDVKAEAESIVGGLANVEEVLNYLTIGSPTSFSNRSNDAFITSKVKSRSLDTGKFNPVHVKVITEAGVVYLMGMLTQSEADAAINVARHTAGVRKVVNLLEIIAPVKARELDVTQSKNNGKPAEVSNP